MPIPESELKKILKNAFPEAKIIIKDVAGDNNHYQVEIIANVFKGLTKLAQHQKVYAVLDEVLKNQLHALSLITRSTGDT